MTQGESFRVVSILAAAFPVPAWSAQTIDLWCEMLLDLEVRTAETAANDWVRSNPERPTIATLRREVAKLSATVQRAGYLSPDEAWGFVSQCLGTVGRYRDFPETYPLVRHAVDLIGWKHICDSENLDVVRGQFRMAYSALLERGVSATAASPGAAQLPEMAIPGRRIGEVHRLEDSSRRQQTEHLSRRGDRADGPVDPCGSDPRAQLRRADVI